MRTLEKCRKHSPAARVFYISLVFSNDHRVLSQYNTRLRLLYLLSNHINISDKVNNISFVYHKTITDVNTSERLFHISHSKLA